jgi:hypothetical protein
MNQYILLATALNMFKLQDLRLKNGAEIMLKWARRLLQAYINVCIRTWHLILRVRRLMGNVIGFQMVRLSWKVPD